MEARIEQDRSRGKGYAVLTVSECPYIADRSHFTLERNSDRMYLSSEGRWLNTVERIPSSEMGYRNGSLVIPLSPALVRELLSLETYTLILDGKAICSFSVDDMAFDAVASRTTGAVAGVQPPPPQRPKPSSFQPGIPETSPLQQYFQGPEQPSGTPFQRLVPVEQEDPQPPDEPKTTLGPNLETPPRRKVRGAVIAATLVLCLAVAGAVWWFLLRGGSSSLPPAQQPAQQAESQPPVRGKAFLNHARSLLRDHADGKTSLEQAKPLRRADATKDESDGAFLLIEDAAQQGEPEAMFLLAQFYDPLSTLPRGTIGKDESQALDWYRKAAASQVQGADAAFAALRSHLQQKADAGDRQARQILKDF